jgi:hypothetical protein
LTESLIIAIIVSEIKKREIKMKATVNIVPVRTIAEVVVDFHGVEQKFNNVDITDTDSVWVAIDDLGSCALFTSKPYSEDGYWQTVKAGFCVMTASFDPEVEVHWAKSLLKFDLK